MYNLDQAFASPALITEEGYQAPQHFLILGLGESGYAMAKWCLRNGAKVSLADTRDREKLNERQKVWLSDLEFLGLQEIYFGPLDALHLKNIDVIGISPGLSPLQEPIISFLTKTQELNIDIWGELEFFARGIAALDRMAHQYQSQYKPALLAITGTNGKTTTTALTGQLCERAGKRLPLREILVQQR
jgi:UDP-N-acetylmuramoylalanine--D-glutamate ligase